MSSVDLRELAIDRGTPSATRLRRRRHVLTRYLLPLVLLAGFVSLALWASWDMMFPPRAVTVVPVHATRAAVQREGTPLFKAAGWVEPRPTAIRVAALSPGVVERLLVVEDQEVKAGEPVAELIKDDARLSLERANADYKLREAEVEEARATLVAATTRFEQPVHLQAPLNEAESALAQIETQLKNLPFETTRAEAALKLARKSFEGKQALKGAVSGLVIAQAQSEFEAAEALVMELKERDGSLQREKAALAARRDSLKKQAELLADEIRARDEAKARLDAALAQVEQARVAVDEAKLKYSRMTISAPVDGRIYRLISPPGSTLSGAMVTSETYDGNTVVTMYRPASLQVRVDVRFENIPVVSLGQPVTIENPALKEPLTGNVLFVSSQANIQKNTLEVKVAIDSPPPVFKPEMLVDVTFLAPPQTDAPPTPTEEMRIYVPQQLIHHDDGGSFVWLADQSAGRARRTTVETGTNVGDGLIQVTSGLTVSSWIVADGSEGLQDGQRIRITGETSSAGDSSTATSGGKLKAMHRLHPGGNR